MENILNVIVAASNYRIIYPMRTVYRRGDLVTLVILGNLGFASTMSHLVESHKHGMSGFGISKSVSERWNWYDMISCYLAGIRLVYLVFNRYSMMNILTDHRVLLIRLLFSWSFLRISEYDKYNKSLRPIYVAAHTIWHITIYDIIYDIYRMVACYDI